MAAPPPPFSGTDFRISPSGPFQPGGAGGAPLQTDVFAGPGPAFALSLPPTSPANASMYINGVRYTLEPGVWTLVGQIATWSGVLFALAPGDEIVFQYEA